MSLKKSAELIETLTEVSIQAEKLAPVASKLATQVKKVTAFLVRCHRCHNEPRTERELEDESLRIRKTRNVYQVKGKCAHCQSDVTGFLPTAKAEKLAHDRNLPIDVLPPKDKTEVRSPPARRRKAAKRKASEMDVVVGEVGTDEPLAKENKQ